MSDKVFYTQEEVAKYLGVTIYAVRKWRGSGKLGFVRIGKVVRIHRDSLDAFISAHTHDVEEVAV